MGPIIWYPEPRCASMGMCPALVPVANVSKAVLDRQFPQQQIITQIQTFRDKVTMMNLRQDELEHQLTDLQHSLADLAILSARQEQFQKTCLEELRSLNTQAPILPQSTQSTSPHPSSAHPRTLFAACPSSLSPTTSPFHLSSHLVAHLPTPRYLPQPYAISPSSHPPPPPTLFIPSAPSPLFGTTSSSQPSSSIAPTTQSFQSFSTSSSAFTLPTSSPLLKPTTPTPTNAAPPSTFASSFSSFGTPASSASQSSPPPSAPFLYTLTPTTPSSTPATSTTTQAFFTMSSFVVIPGTSPAPNPAATTAPMAASVMAATQTSTSLVAASTRGTTSNVSTTVFTTPKLPSETRAVVGPSSSLTYTSKTCSNVSFSSVRSSLCSYFRADGLVNTVLVNHVDASRLKGHFQTYNDNRVVPPLGTPTDAMEKLPPKADVLQIAHPIHPPKEPDKARRCQVPILYSPLQQARLHLEFIPHYMTFAMIVFNSYGSRRNILAHDVFDKRQNRAIDQNYVPHLLFMIRNVPRAIELIWVFQTTFLTGTFGWVSLCFVDSFDLHELYNQYIKFGEPIEYSAYLDTISQPQKIPRKLKSSRQYREYMENLLACLIHFFQRPEPLQDLDRIFLKVETEFEEQWAPGKVKGWENEKQANGHVQDQLTMLDLDYSSTGEELMAVGPAKLKEALASLGLQTGGTVQRAGETTLGSPITLLTGTFAGVSLCSMDIFFRMIGNAPKWEFPGRGSMICSTIWNNILTLMANGIFSTFMSGLTKVISTFTLSRHMIDTMTSVCLVLSDWSTCAIEFILGNTLSVFPTLYFLEYLFTNTIGSQLLHGRKMKHTAISNDSLVLLSRWVWISIIIASMPIQGSVLSSNLFVVVLSQDHVIGRAVPDSMVAVKTTTGHPMVAGTPTRADNAYAGIDATANQIQLLMVIFYYLLHCIIHHDPKLELFRHSRDEKTLEAIGFGLYACSVQPTKQLITVVEDTCCLGPRIIPRSHGTKAYMYCDGLTNIVEKLRYGEHIWHVDYKDLVQSYCKLIIIPMTTYLNAKSNLEFIAPLFVTSVCGSYDFESYFPEYLHLFKALVALHFQWYHVFATVVSMSMVLTAPSALAGLSNESESVFCQVFSGFVPLGSLAFTVVNDSQQLELNVKVEKLLENQISLFTDYISELSWIMVATREFLTWRPSVSFFCIPPMACHLLQFFQVFWFFGFIIWQKLAILHACWTCGLFGDSHCTSFGSIYHDNFLAPHGLGEPAAPASTCQLDGMRTCLI